MKMEDFGKLKEGDIVYIQSKNSKDYLVACRVLTNPEPIIESYHINHVWQKGHLGRYKQILIERVDGFEFESGTESAFPNYPDKHIRKASNQVLTSPPDISQSVAIIYEELQNILLQFDQALEKCNASLAMSIKGGRKR